MYLFLNMKTINVTLIILCIVLFSMYSNADIRNNEIEKCNVSEDLLKEIKGYQPVANKIINAVLYGKYENSTYNHLADFIDKFGNRMSGTENLEKAIDYMLDKSKYYNLENVHAEETVVPYWIR